MCAVRAGRGGDARVLPAPRHKITGAFRRRGNSSAASAPRASGPEAQEFVRRNLPDGDAPSSTRRRGSSARARPGSETSKISERAARRGGSRGVGRHRRQGGEGSARRRRGNQIRREQFGVDEPGSSARPPDPTLALADAEVEAAGGGGGAAAGEGAAAAARGRTLPAAAASALRSATQALMGRRVAETAESRPRSSGGGGGARRSRGWRRRAVTTFLRGSSPPPHRRSTTARHADTHSIAAIASPHHLTVFIAPGGAPRSVSVTSPLRVPIRHDIDRTNAGVAAGSCREPRPAAPTLPLRDPRSPFGFGSATPSRAVRAEAASGRLREASLATSRNVAAASRSFMGGTRSFAASDASGALGGAAVAGDLQRGHGDGARERVHASHEGRVFPWRAPPLAVGQGGRGRACRRSRTGRKTAWRARAPPERARDEEDAGEMSEVCPGGASRSPGRARASEDPEPASGSLRRDTDLPTADAPFELEDPIPSGPRTARASAAVKTPRACQELDTPVVN